MEVFNPKFQTYKALGALTGTTAEIYATVQAVLDSGNLNEPVWLSPLSARQIINAGDKCISLGFADLFKEDNAVSIPLAVKYGFQVTNYVPISPNGGDYRNLLPGRREEFLQIEKSGCYLGDHTYMHYPYFYAMPLYDGRNTPSNDDLRVDAGSGKNAWDHFITDTVRDSISTMTVQYLNLSDTLADKQWSALSDEDCASIRKSMSAFGRINSRKILEGLDYLSNRYCGTVGYSVLNGDYTTRTPNTEGGVEPDAEHKIQGGIFTGASSTCNHEIWERMIKIMKAYCAEFLQPLYGDYIFCSTSGGGSSKLYFGTNYNKYNDPLKTKLASGATTYTSSITGQTRSLIDVYRAAGYKTSLLCMGMGYAYVAYDGIKRLEGQRCYKYNQAFHKPDYVGDGYVNALRFYDNTIPNADVLTLLASTDLVKEYYDYVYITERYTGDTAETNNFYDLINTICKYNAWGIIPDMDSDFTPVTLDHYASATLALEALYQFCYRVGIKVIAREMAFKAVNEKQFPVGYNYFPNYLMATTPKTILSSLNAPEHPDGWNGGVVISEDTGSGAVNVLHINADGTIFTRQYAIKPGAFNLSFRAKGIGTLKVRKILNKNTYNNTSGAAFTEINSISINSPSEYTSYSDTVIIPDAPMETYSAPTTPREEAYQNYMKGFGDKICGIQIELIITGGNYIKIGNCSLV